jgi:sporulation protein YlmC with PRC-barrel domain
MRQGGKSMTTAEPMTQFTIGAHASCADGDCGEVTRVVVDPLARVVTHLVVEPRHRRGVGRLVPLDLVEVKAGDVRLGCTIAEFDKLDPAEETRFLPGYNGYGGYAAGQVSAWPYYGLGMGNIGFGGMGNLYMGNATQPVTTDTVPAGDVDVRRDEQVHASDGDIGRVQGLVIDPRTHHVTHVLLQEGHLFGRKEVAIPIGAVTRIDTGIGLDLTKQQVKDLPSVDIDHQTA